MPCRLPALQPVHDAGSPAHLFGDPMNAEPPALHDTRAAAGAGTWSGRKRACSLSRPRPGRNSGRWISVDPNAEAGFRRRNAEKRVGEDQLRPTPSARTSLPNTLTSEGFILRRRDRRSATTTEKEHPATNVEDPERVNWEGTVICEGGTPYPCIFNKSWKAGFRKEGIFDCFMKHEQSHGGDAQKQKRCDTCLLHKSVPEVRKAPNCHECPPVSSEISTSRRHQVGVQSTRRFSTP